MSLADLNSLSSLLVCPACNEALATSDGTYRCTSASCELAAGPFRTVGVWPVLVDHRTSVLEPDGLPVRGATHSRSRRRWSAERLPGWLRPFWKPYNRVAARNIERLLTLLDGTSGRLVLVVGGGQIGNGIDRLYTDPRVEVLGFDLYESELTQFIADAHQIPVADESIDAVVIQAVLEHVLDPVQVVSEVERVLKPAGLVYAETPFLQQVHDGALDFVRYTSSGHRYLFRAFDEIAAGPVAGPGTQLQWSLDHTVRALLRSELAGKLVRGLFFWLRYVDELVPMSAAMDNASAYFFLGRKTDHVLTAREIVSYYKGAQR
jgi:SAM-dependent methyltransferase